jgi:uncharacterized membrane protein
MLTSIIKILRTNILLGLALITPLAVTVIIVNFLFQFINQNAFLTSLSRVLPETMRDSGYERVIAQILALVIAIMLLFLIGFFVRSFFGRRLYQLGEKVLERIPVINKIYIWVRQISEAFLAQRQTLFKEVVLVEYPRKGLYSVAFVTAPVAPDLETRLKHDESGDHVSLFIPTTPNPTSGLMIIAARRDLQPLGISVADAMKLIISAGAVYPGDGLVDNRPTLVDKLESWISKDGKTDSPAP